MKQNKKTLATAEGKCQCLIRNTISAFTALLTAKLLFRLVYAFTA